MEKPKRKPNFAEVEKCRLVEEYEKEIEMITSKFGPNITSRKKHEAWIRITAAMNARNPSVVRTKRELLKKWQNMSSNMKDEYRKFRKESARTGGGPPPDQPSHLSQKIASIIGENDPTVYGIDGGIDSLVPIASPSTSLSSCSRYFHHVQDTGANVVIAKRKQLSQAASTFPMYKSTYSAAATLPKPCPALEDDLEQPKKKKKSQESSELVALQKELLSLEKERAILEIEKLKMEKEKLSLEIELLQSQKKPKVSTSTQT